MKKIMNVTVLLLIMILNSPAILSLYLNNFQQDNKTQNIFFNEQGDSSSDDEQGNLSDNDLNGVTESAGDLIKYAKAATTRGQFLISDKLLQQAHDQLKVVIDRLTNYSNKLIDQMNNEKRLTQRQRKAFGETIAKISEQLIQAMDNKAEVEKLIENNATAKTKQAAMNRTTAEIQERFRNKTAAQKAQLKIEEKVKTEMAAEEAAIRANLESSDNYEDAFFNVNPTEIFESNSAEINDHTIEYHNLDEDTAFLE